jgi:hypothetical protein
MAQLTTAAKRPFRNEKTATSIGIDSKSEMNPSSLLKNRNIFLENSEKRNI